MSEYQRLLEAVKKAHVEMERRATEYLIWPNDMTATMKRLSEQDFWKAQKALAEFSQRT